MMNKIKTVLELIRLPGMFTAHADILAAFLITGAEFEKINTLLLVLLSSSCLFSAGMALNDYFDVETDRRERPQRPIPSGRISGSMALLTGIGLLGAGICFAIFAGVRPFCVSLALASVILIYDGLFKDIPFIGPLTMASCRYFNLLMGLSILPVKGWAVIPLITGIYIFGVTLLSRKEADGGKAVFNITVCALSIGMVPLLYYFFYMKHIFLNFSGALLAFLLAIFLSTSVLRLLEKNTPADFQKTMRILLLAIIALDVVLAAGVAPLGHAAGILLLYLPALFSVRLFRVT